MKQAVYIRTGEAISPLDTFGKASFPDAIVQPEGAYFTCIQPDYAAYINPVALRRMSKILRMSITAAQSATKNAGLQVPDAIIVGTGLGCLLDTHKFLEQMIAEKESLLNPTSFIMSTHNTISGAIALQQGCKQYNFTYSQQFLSFETALTDAYMLLQEPAYKNILVGGVDEMIDAVNVLLQKNGCTKDSQWGEGAAFFMLTNENSTDNICAVRGIRTGHGAADITGFLHDHGINAKDVIVLGTNDPSIPQVTCLQYKHLCGEYMTASAFGMWLAARIIKEQRMPEALFTGQITTQTSPIRNVLLYNTHKNSQHSLILLSSCETSL